MYSNVGAHMSWFEVRVRGRYKTILTSAPGMGCRTIRGGVPIAPAIQAGVVYVGCPVGMSSCSASWHPAPLGHSFSQGAIDRVAHGSISDMRVEELRRYFPLLPIIVKMRGNVKGYLGSCQALFDSFLLLFKLPLGQMKVLLLLLDTPSLSP